MEKSDDDYTKKIIEVLPQVESIVNTVSDIGNRVDKMKKDFQTAGGIFKTSTNMEEILKFLPRTINLFGLKIRLKEVVEYFSIFITLFISIATSMKIFFAPDMEIDNTVLIVLVVCSCIIITFIYFNGKNFLEIKKLEMSKYDQSLEALEKHLTAIANTNVSSSDNLIDILKGNKKVESKFNALVSCLVDKFPPEQFEEFFKFSE